MGTGKISQKIVLNQLRRRLFQGVVLAGTALFSVVYLVDFDGKSVLFHS